MRVRSFVPLLIGVLVLGSSLTLPAWSQPKQPLPEEAARELVRAALLQYFDPSSEFEISVSGAAIAGDLLSIEDLLVSGKPALVRGFRGEFLARVAGLQLEVAGLNAQPKSAREVTVVARTTAKAVEEGLSKASPNIMRPTVRFQAGELEISATLRREGKLYPILARGTLVVEQRKRVILQVTRVQVDGGDLPENMIARELANFNPLIDLSRWPLNIQIQRLTIHNNALELLLSKAK